MSDGPDFLCIGAEKAGTTWLYDNIRHHPEVWLPPPPFKELHYFDDKAPNRDLLHLGRFVHGGLFRRYSPLLREPRLETLRWLWRFNYHASGSMHWYRSLFDKSRGVCGDITPLYSTLDEQGVAYARKVVGNDCKTFIILRDPVSRTWSSIKMLYRFRKADITQETQEEIIREIKLPYMALKSDYSRIIKTWTSYFGEDNFHIFYYDDLAADNIKFLRSMCSYLNLSNTDWSPPSPGKASNQDKLQLGIPDEIQAALSRFYLPELELLSQQLGGYASTWLQKAKQAVG